MTPPYYIDLDQAREVLAEMGVELSERQMKRAAETDAHGCRKLPFYVDPVEGKLKIDKNTLIEAYLKRQVEAQKRLRM